MTQGRNQKYLRKRNKGKILQLLSRNPMSYSELARELNLSNTAIGNIVNDLIESGIVERESDVLGRLGIRIKLRQQIGYIVAIDLSKAFSEICAVTLTNELIYKGKVDFEYKIGEQTINEIFEIIDSIVEEQKKTDMRLCCISIATPGKLDKKTGYFVCAPRFQNYEQVNLEKIFSARYDCPVIVKNDTNLAMEGFRSKNSEIKDAIMIYNGIGLGCALLLDGKVYEGHNGFAGEIGLYSMNLFAQYSTNLASFYEQDNYADTTLSLLGIFRAVRKGIGFGKMENPQSIIDEKGEIVLENLAEEYKKDNEFVSKIVDAHAIVMARFLKNIVQILDVDLIVLDGEITVFGEKYLNVLMENFGGKVVMSETKQNLALLGAIEEGYRLTLESKIEKI